MTKALIPAAWVRSHRIPIIRRKCTEKCMEEIFLPTVHAMNAEGRTFCGCLYFGLMLTPKGPKVIEYNCRFGDPETQVVLPLLESDLLTIMQATVNGTLEQTEVRFSKKNACLRRAGLRRVPCSTMKRATPSPLRIGRGRKNRPCVPRGAYEAGRRRYRSYRRRTRAGRDRYGRYAGGSHRASVSGCGKNQLYRFTYAPGYPGQRAAWPHSTKEEEA